MQDVVRYQYDNHLGSASLELDENAATISYEEYHPFGTSSYRLHRNSTEASLKRYRYVGKERDEETGLYYYGARYYAAWIGRWTATDPMANQRVTFNPYNYCQNNPINRTDPTGALDDDPPKFLNGHQALTNDIFESWIHEQGLKKVTLNQLYKNEFDKDTVGEYWKWQKTKGYILEKAFLDAFNLDKNTYTNEEGSIPDAVTDSDKIEVELYFRNGVILKSRTDVETFKGAALFEVKANASTVEFSDQIRKHINAAAAAENDEGETAGDEKSAFLYIITLAGVKISDEILEEATDNNVNIIHMQASYDEDTREIGFSIGQLKNDIYWLWEHDSQMTIELDQKIDARKQVPQQPDWEGAIRNRGGN